MSDKQIIEINGIKLEIDMRYAKRVEEFKIGDNVKVLVKKYSDQFTSYPGVIVGFDAFDKLPTIVIAYLEVDYSTAGVRFVYFNSKTENIEICHMGDAEKIIDRQSTLDLLRRDVDKKEAELHELKARQAYFLSYYDKYFKGEPK